MKKSIILTSVLSFVLLFTLSVTLIIFFQPEAMTQKSVHMGMMTVISPTGILISLAISGILASVVTVLNYADNLRLRNEFAKDIERLTLNEKPTNPELEPIREHIEGLSAELQRLSQPSTEMRSEIVEEERKRISRELHDSVSQELFAATMILSSVQNSSDLTTVQSQTQLSLKILHEAQNEMRALLLHLRPTELDGKSLSIGLTALINELTAKISANINYRLDDVQSTQTIEDNLFRMAQEVLSNTLRHAHAQNIEISLVENKGNIVLVITDDGLGFDQEEKKSASYGLSNLRERALLLGGYCEITAAPEQGTKVEIRIPKVN